MPDSLSRYAPLTGLAGVVLFVVGVFTGSEPPSASSSQVKVIHYYGAHRSSVETTSVLIAISLVLLMMFAASLRAYLRRTESAEGVASLVLAGLTITATAGLLATAIEYSLAHNLLVFTAPGVQALNVIAQEVVLPILAGVFLTALAAFLAAIVRGAALPRWLGWLALLVAVLSAITPLGFVGFLAFIVWVAATSIVMFMRTDAAAGDGARPATGPAPAQSA